MGLVSDFQADRGERDGREGRCACDVDAMIPGESATERGSRQGLRHEGLRGSECRELNVAPHVAQRKRWSAIDGRTTRHEGYRSSQKARKRVESIFGCMKTVGGFRRSQVRGFGAKRTVWGVGGDGVQSGEDVEADIRAGVRSACLRLVFHGRGAPIRPRLGL